MNRPAPQAPAGDRCQHPRSPRPAILTSLVAGTTLITACQDSTPSESTAPPITFGDDAAVRDRQCGIEPCRYRAFPVPVAGHGQPGPDHK